MKTLSKSKGVTKDKVFTKKQLAEFSKLFKVGSYEMWFTIKGENGYNTNYVIMSKNRYFNQQTSSENIGYQKRIAEEKTKTIYDLMEAEAI